MNICPNCQQTHDSTACPSRGIEEDPPVYQPNRQAYSREELVNKMNLWMEHQFGHPMDYIKDPDQRDRWYRDNGMLHKFICDHFPPNN